MHTVRKKLVRTIEIARHVDKDLNSELHVALDELRLDFVIATSRCDVSFSGEGDADRADADMFLHLMRGGEPSSENQGSSK